MRTSDDATLTIKVMIFYSLVDLETMLNTTHDPIGERRSQHPDHRRP